MSNDLRVTYMSNGMLDIRWKDGRIRQNAIVQREELGLFKLALNYCVNEVPYNTMTSPQIDLLFNSHIPSQLTELLKLPLDSHSLERVLEQLERTMQKLVSREIEDRPIEDWLGIPESKSDIHCLISARTGAGKSTTIKSCSAIPDEVNFPVVSTNRTTTFPTEYVLTHSNTCEFMIEFQSSLWVRQRVEEALCAMIVKFAEVRYGEGQADPELTKQSLSESFVESDEQNLFLSRLILGKYKREPRTPLEVQVNAFWCALTNKIERLVREIVSIDQLHESASPEFLIHYVEKHAKQLTDNITDEVVEVVYGRSRQILVEAEATWRKYGSANPLHRNQGVIENEGVLLGFYGSYTIPYTWEILRYFFSRDSSDNGRAVTPLVKRAKVQIPYNDKFGGQYPVISLHDIVGYGHTNAEIDSGSLEGSTSINYLDYDAIVVLERADDPMNEVTRKILHNVLQNAMKNKVVIGYSHYHRFTMDDWADETFEEERQHQLRRLQEQALIKMGENPTFVRELSEQRTLFLEFDVHEVGTRRKKRVIEEKHLAENFVAKIVEVVEAMRKIQAYPTNRLNYDFRKLVVVYHEATKEFIANQHKEYWTYPPHWKTTEALTKRLSHGETFFQGTRRTLKPVDDYHNSLMKQLRIFIEKPLAETGLDKEAVNLAVDRLKENVAQALKRDIRDIFLNRNQDWKDAYLYSGSGSDTERRNKLIQTFEELVPGLRIDVVRASDYWIQLMEKRITDALSDSVSSKMTYS